jgi:chromatin segregation and condensation protein Rec8/ScpA/Scc1 (kleisin family)
LTARSQDPFWLHQPWRILTDILELQKISPWELDLAELVNGFIGRLLTEDFDFRICGRALLSAAILLRYKTEYLLEFGREEETITEIEEDIFLPPIRPPFRQQVRPVSETELVEALRELVFPSTKRKRKRRVTIIPTPEEFGRKQESDFQFRKWMQSIYEQLREASLNDNPVSFSEFVKGLTRVEIVRIFLTLMFLLGENKLLISQDVTFGDILIRFLEPDRDEVEVNA